MSVSRIDDPLTPGRICLPKIYRIDVAFYSLEVFFLVETDLFQLQNMDITAANSFVHVLIAYAQNPLKTHTDVSNGACDLILV